MKFYFVRHGQTDWNREKKLIGWGNPSLNEEGLRQAQEILKELPEGVDVLYSSPQNRAMETAKIISEFLNIPIVAKSGLMERNFGDLAGKNWDDIEQQYGSGLRGLDRQQKYDYRPYGGESAEQVKERLLKFIEEAKAQNPAKPLVVCHGGIIRMLHYLYTNQEMPNIKNASVHVFDL